MASKPIGTFLRRIRVELRNRYVPILVPTTESQPAKKQEVKAARAGS